MKHACVCLYCLTRVISWTLSLKFQQFVKIKCSREPDTLQSQTGTHLYNCSKVLYHGMYVCLCRDKLQLSCQHAWCTRKSTNVVICPSCIKHFYILSALSCRSDAELWKSPHNLKYSCRKLSSYHTVRELFVYACMYMASFSFSNNVCIFEMLLILSDRPWQLSCLIGLHVPTTWQQSLYRSCHSYIGQAKEGLAYCW